MTPSQLRALRLSWSLSPAEMARLCRVTLDRYGKIERGQARFGAKLDSYLLALVMLPAYRAAMFRERGIKEKA